MRIRLLTNQADGVPVPIVIDKLPALVGQSDRANVRLGGDSVSQCHCKLTNFEGNLIVHDLESENGTLVNGVSVLQAPVFPGDRLTLGSYRFVVAYEREATEEPPERLLRGAIAV